MMICQEYLDSRAIANACLWNLMSSRAFNLDVMLMRLPAQPTRLPLYRIWLGSTFRRQTDREEKMIKAGNKCRVLFRKQVKIYGHSLKIQPLIWLEEQILSPTIGKNVDKYFTVYWRFRSLLENDKYVENIISRRWDSM